MSESSLPSIYADPRHYDVLAQMTAPEDIDYWLAQAAGCEGEILELGCGTGRVTVPLARAGNVMHGIDVSEPLLAFARDKVASAGLSVRFDVCDCRDLDLQRRFALVIMPYNAFNHLMNESDVRRCFDSVRCHLAPDGRFVIDTFNPDPDALHHEVGPPELILQYIDPYNGARTELWESDVYDKETGINHITWSYEIDGRARARVDELAMRIWFPGELESLIHSCGWQIESRVGDYCGEAFDPRSAKQLLTCKPQESG